MFQAAQYTARQAEDDAVSFEVAHGYTCAHCYQTADRCTCGGHDNTPEDSVRRAVTGADVELAYLEAGHVTVRGMLILLTTATIVLLIGLLLS